MHRIQMGLVRKLWGQLTNCGIGPRNASRRDEGLISSVIEVIVGKATFPQVPPVWLESRGSIIIQSAGYKPQNGATLWGGRVTGMPSAVVGLDGRNSQSNRRR